MDGYGATGLCHKRRKMNLIKKVGIADNKLLLHNFAAILTYQFFLSGRIHGIKDYMCARERSKLLNIQVTPGSE